LAGIFCAGSLGVPWDCESCIETSDVLAEAVVDFAIGACFGGKVGNAFGASFALQDQQDEDKTQHLQKP
jgi:hypothetical protein